MSLKTLSRISLAAFLAWSAVACSSATPAATSTPTDVVEPATATVEPPTSTPAPTETPEPTAAQPGSQEPTPADPAGATQPPAAAPTAAAAGVSAGPAAEHYKYVSQNLADKKQIRPGVPVTISWTVQNTGTDGWSADCTLDYFAGVKGQTNSIKLGKTVPPNGQVTVSVTFTTPTIAGDYNTWWKLTNTQGQHFGDVDFSFTVTSTPGAVPTPTP